MTDLSSIKFAIKINDIDYMDNYNGKCPNGSFGNSCACHTVEILHSVHDLSIIQFLCSRTGHQLFSDDVDNFIIRNFKTEKEFVLSFIKVPTILINFINYNRISYEYRIAFIDSKIHISMTHLIKPELNYGLV